MVPIELITSENIQLALESYLYFAENPNEVSYGGVKKDELIDFILDITQQDDLQKALPVLQGILVKKLEEENRPVEVPQQPNATVPQNIGSLVQDLNKYLKEKKEHSQLLNKAVSQRANIDNSLLSQLSKEESEILRKWATDDTEGFEYDLSRRLQQDHNVSDNETKKVVTIYSDYIKSSADGQIVAGIDTNKIASVINQRRPVAVSQLLRFGDEVKVVAETLAVPVAAVSVSKNTTPISTAQIQSGIQSQIDEAVAQGVAISKSAKELTDEYQIARTKARPNEVAVVNIKRSRIDTVPITSNQSPNGEDLIRVEVYGPQTELIKMATQERLAETAVPVMPIRTITKGISAPKIIVATNKTIEDIFGKEAADFLVPESRKPTVTVQVTPSITTVAKIIAAPVAFSSASGQENLVQQVKQNPAGLAKKLEDEIQKEVVTGPNQILSETEKARITKVVDNYVSYLSQLTPASTETPVLDANKIKANLDGEIKLKAVLEFLPQNEAEPGEIINSQNFGSNAEDIRTSVDNLLPNALPLLPVVDDSTNQLVLLPTIKILSEIREVKSSMNVNPDEVHITPSEIEPETIPTGSFWATSVGQAYVRIGIDKIAEEDPTTAAALKVNGHTEELRNAIIATGGNPQIVDILMSRLDEITNNKGKLPDALDIATATASLPFTEDQLRILSTQTTGVTSYAVYNQAFVQQGSFIGNIVSGPLRRVFGSRAQNFVEGTLRNSLASGAKKAGQAFIGRVASTAAGRAVIATVGAVSGVVTGGLSIAGGWILSKAKIGIKTNIGKVLAGMGALVGFVLGGPIGIIVGGLVGAGLAGLDWKKIGGWAKWITSTLAAYFLAKAILPLVVTLCVLIGGTIFVSFALYVINSGAYVVPAGVGGGINSGPPGIGQEWNCPNQSIPKPTNVKVLYSSDHQYAFPLSEDKATSYACYHWDGGLATDIFVSENGRTREVQDPVVAYRSGTIELTSTNDALGGKYVILNAGHPDANGNQYYYYAHLCGLYVQQGQKVSVGDVLATSDNTGNAENTPEHLHFAISNTDTFYTGGTYCPQIDFEQHFGPGRCDVNTACIKGAKTLK